MISLRGSRCDDFIRASRANPMWVSIFCCHVKRPPGCSGATPCRSENSEAGSPFDHNMAAAMGAIEIAARMGRESNGKHDCSPQETRGWGETVMCVPSLISLPPQRPTWSARPCTLTHSPSLSDAVRQSGRPTLLGWLHVCMRMPCPGGWRVALRPAARDD